MTKHLLSGRISMRYGVVMVFLGMILSINVAHAQNHVGIILSGHDEEDIVRQFVQRYHQHNQ